MAKCSGKYHFVNCLGIGKHKRKDWRFGEKNESLIVDLELLFCDNCIQFYDDLKEEAK